MAAWQARRINKYLDKPVSLITDRASVNDLKSMGIAPYQYFDEVIINEEASEQTRKVGSEWVKFRNTDRVDAFRLSPYDETLLMDTDIFIASNRLNRVWGNQEDLLVSKKSRDLFNRKQGEFDYLKEHGVEFYWATECYFRKTEGVGTFFEACRRVKRDYNWNSKVYGVPSQPLRNDHVWSMALHELGGKAHSKWAQPIPGTLTHCIDIDNLMGLTEDSAIVLGQVGDTDRVATITGQDLHIMNKGDLMKYAQIELGVGA
jgi:hypothetical protein